MQFRPVLHSTWVQLTWRRRVYVCSGIHRPGITATASSCSTRCCIASRTTTSMIGPPTLQCPGSLLRVLSRSRIMCSRSVRTQVKVAVHGAIHILCRCCHRVSSCSTDSQRCWFLANFPLKRWSQGSVHDLAVAGVANGTANGSGVVPWKCLKLLAN